MKMKLPIALRKKRPPSCDSKKERRQQRSKRTKEIKQKNVINDNEHENSSTTVFIENMSLLKKRQTAQNKVPKDNSQGQEIDLCIVKFNEQSMMETLGSAVGALSRCNEDNRFLYSEHKCAHCQRMILWTDYVEAVQEQIGTKQLVFHNECHKIREHMIGTGSNRFAWSHPYRRKMTTGIVQDGEASGRCEETNCRTLENSSCTPSELTLESKKNAETLTLLERTNGKLSYMVGNFVSDMMEYTKAFNSFFEASPEQDICVFCKQPVVENEIFTMDPDSKHPRSFIHKECFEVREQFRNRRKRTNKKATRIK